MFGRRIWAGSTARVAPAVLAAALLSSSILVASVTGTLSAFTASIENSTNTATSGSLVMKETNSSGSVVCLSTDANSTNTATCGTIDKYGGTGTALSPGASSTPTIVKIANLGATAVSAFTLTPGACTSSRASMSIAATSGNLCGALKLTVTCTLGGTTATVVNAIALNAMAASYDVKQLSSGACVPAAAEASTASFSFTLTMDGSANASVQNQVVSQPLTWTFNGA